MREWARNHLSYANIAATLALVIGLTGGTAYAVEKIKGSQIAKNAIAAKHIRTDAVGAEQLRSGAVGASELTSGAVTTTTVKDGSLQAGDLAAGVLPAGSYTAHGSSVGLGLDLSDSYQLVATTDGKRGPSAGAWVGPLVIPAVKSWAFFPYIAQLQVTHSGSGTGSCRLVRIPDNGWAFTDPFAITDNGMTSSGVSGYFYQPDNSGPKSVQLDVECKRTGGSLTVTGATLTVIATRR